MARIALHGRIPDPPNTINWPTFTASVDAIMSTFFYRADPDGVAISASADGLILKAGVIVFVDDRLFAFTEDRIISVPALEPITEYSVFVTSSGDVIGSAGSDAPSGYNGIRKIGGFATDGSAAFIPASAWDVMSWRMAQAAAAESAAQAGSYATSASGSAASAATKAGEAAVSVTAAAGYAASASSSATTASAAASAASEGLKMLTGVFGRLYQKGGVWQVVEEYLGIDKIGRVVGVDFVRNGDVPLVLKGGIIKLIMDAAGSPYAWYEARLARVRLAGDMHDRPERVAGSPASILAGRHALLSFGPDGQVYQPASEAAPVAYTRPFDDGGGPVQQVCVADGASERRLTASIVDCYAPAIIAPGLVRYARADGTIGLARSVRGLAEGGTTLDGHFSYGQSLAIGSSSFAPGTLPILRYSPSADVLSFNGGVRAGIDGGGYNSTSYGSFVPAAEDVDGSTLLSDTGLTALGFGMARETGRDVLVCAAGVGGTPYADLKKGTTPYNNFLYGITRAKALADAAGRPFVLRTVNWRQGESDEGKDVSTYLGYLGELLVDLPGDVVAITGQATPPLIVLQQISRFGGAAGADTLTGPAWAQGYAGLNTAGCILIGPQYVCDFGDVYHMQPASYCLMASYQAKAVRRHLYQGRPWKPLHVVSAVRTGRRIDVTIGGGVVDYGGAITIDTSRVSNPNKYGVVFRDSTVSATVASVEVTGRNTLAVYLTVSPSGSTAELGFGYWKAGTETGQGRLTGLRTCIRDNDAEGCPVTGLPLHNYLISQKIGVTT